MTTGAHREGWWRGLLGGGADTRRALLALLSGVVAVQLGFVLVSPRLAERCIIHGGYFYILGVFAAFLVFAARLLRERQGVWRGWLAKPGLPGLVILLASVFVLLSDPFEHKIHFDEFVLQSTAGHMHLTKEVSAIYRSYWLDGSFIPIDGFLDKRPYFFTFLVSLVHDLTGYRVANLFIVNALLTPVFLGLVHWLGSALAGRRAGMLAVVLLATLPLLGQNATGASMELHNLTMLALTLALAVLYLRNPDTLRLGLLCLSTVLLAQSRYESVIFAGPVGLVILAGWARLGRPLISWTAIATPLLFIPYAWHTRVVSATPLLWQLQEGQSSRFSLEYLSGNLEGAWAFFANTGGQFASSPLLSLLGLAALVWIGWRLWLRERRPVREPLPAAAVAAAAFGAGVAANLGMLQFYYWARLDDVIAARFSLPSYLMASLAAGLFVAGLERWRRGAFRWAFAAVGVYLAVFAYPVMANRLYTTQNMVAREVEWERAVVGDMPVRPRLIIANKSTIPWVIDGVPAVIVGVARQRADQIRYHMEQGTFQEVIVTQSLRATTPEGNMGVDSEDLLPARFRLETLAERRFGGRVGRISRLVKVDP